MSLYDQTDPGGSSGRLLGGIARKVSAASRLIYSSLGDIRKDGFLIEKAGLALRAAAHGDTEVWSIEPTLDNQFQMVLRSDLDYDPELRSIRIDRKVVASEKDLVDTPYGVGKQVGKSKNGGVIVEFTRDGSTPRRYILDEKTVKAHAASAHITVTAEAKSPAKTPIQEMLKQYYRAIYGDSYADELTSTFGELIK